MNNQNLIVKHNIKFGCKLCNINNKNNDKILDRFLATYQIPKKINENKK